MIKAIVYDLDGMFVNEPRYYYQEVMRKFDIDKEDMWPLKSKKYALCKKGKITLDEYLKPYLEKWGKYPKFSQSLEGVKRDWFELADINQEVTEIARAEKKKGIQNFILTNNTRERVEYLDKKFNLSETFEIVGSYDLGILKPDPSFYEILKKKYNLLPEEVLIFDDKEKNIKKLKKLGFKAEIYRDMGEFKKVLKKYKLNFE